MARIDPEVTLSNERAIRLQWSGAGLQFTGRGTLPETPGMTIDGDGDAGPSPMLTLLLAAASCSASDVLLILRKMRVTVTDLTVDVRGVRREENPRRYMAITYAFSLRSPDATEAQVERAVSLSLETYCSVAHSLAPDIAITHEITLAR